MLVPFKSMPFIGRGVRGHLIDRPGRPLVLAFIAADPEGHGYVGAFLDALDPERETVAPMVTSERLQTMLQRRGFAPEVRFVSPQVGLGLCWVRRPGWAARAPETRTAVVLESLRSDAAEWGIDITAANPRDLAELAETLERLVARDPRQAGEVLAAAHLWSDAV